MFGFFPVGILNLNALIGLDYLYGLKSLQLRGLELFYLFVHIFVCAAVRYPKLGYAFGFIGGAALYEGGGIVVLHSGRAGAHEGRKQPVDYLYYRLGASEVFVQVYYPALEHSRGEARLKGPVFLKEQLGLRLAELVYALLYVSDHEAVVRAAYLLNEAVLNEVAVLIFIHKNVFELLSVFGGCEFVVQYV